MKVLGAQQEGSLGTIVVPEHSHDLPRHHVHRAPKIFVNPPSAQGTPVKTRRSPVYGFDFIWFACHIREVRWVVEIGDEFEPEFDALHEDVQTEILALSRLLQQFGPQLGRPRVDTLNGSRHANMKELRFSAAEGEWRVAFAFDPQRTAILLVAGDKSGASEKRFYRELIRKADDRFDAHLARLKRERQEPWR